MSDSRVLRRSLILLAAMVGLHGSGPAMAQPACTITRITDSAPGFASFHPSLDEGSIAFASDGNLTGENPDGSSEIFLFDGSTIIQITHSIPPSDIFTPGSSEPSLDGDSIAFVSNANLTGANPDFNQEVFLFDGSSISQVTHSTGDDSSEPSLDGRSIAFTSRANLTGNNPGGDPEVFLFDGSTLTQITNSGFDQSFDPSLDKGHIAFTSSANLTGHNLDRSDEIFLFNGSMITQITDFSSIGDGSDQSSLEGEAIAFRSDADLTGDNPDGNYEIFLFDGSTISQITHSTNGNSSLPSLDGGHIAFTSTSDLTGGNPDGSAEIFLFDGASFTQMTDSTESFSFSSEASIDGGSIAFRSNANLTGSQSHPGEQIFLACSAPALPPGPYLTSDELPGFRFKVRITSGSSGHRRAKGDRLHRRDPVRKRRPGWPFRALRADHRPPAQRVPLVESGAFHAVPGGGLGRADRYREAQLLRPPGPATRGYRAHRKGGQGGVPALGRCRSFPLTQGHVRNGFKSMDNYRREEQTL